MKDFNQIILILTSVLLAMIIGAVSMENPLTVKYESVLKAKMNQEYIQDESELLKAYPALLAVKNNMEQIEDLKMQLGQVTGNPSPGLSREGGEESMDQQLKIRQLTDQSFHLLESLEMELVAAK